LGFSIRIPDRFEYFRLTPDTVYPKYLATTEGEEHEKRILDLDSTFLATPMLETLGNDCVTYGCDLFCLDGVPLPVLKEPAHIVPYLRRPDSDTELGEVATDDEHHMLI
jgi:hypothetical protein